MARYVDPAKVLDDLEQQVARATIANIAQETIDNHVRQQIFEAVHEAAYRDLLNHIERSLSTEVRDTVAQLAYDIERELRQVWLE
jgi:hypothetical protein